MLLFLFKYLLHDVAVKVGCPAWFECLYKGWYKNFYGWWYGNVESTLNVYDFDLTVMPVSTPGSRITTVDEYKRLCSFAVPDFELYGQTVSTFFQDKMGTIILTMNNTTNVSHGLAVLGTDAANFEVLSVFEMQAHYAKLHTSSACAIVFTVCVYGITPGVMFAAWILLVLFGGDPPTKAGVISYCIMRGYTNATLVDDSPTECALAKKAGFNVVQVPRNRDPDGRPNGMVEWSTEQDSCEVMSVITQLPSENKSKGINSFQFLN